MVGWRFARKRRWARTRFIPTDWGLNPEIESFPQRTQKRAMTFSLLCLTPKRDATPLVPYRSRNARGLSEPPAEGGIMPSEPPAEGGIMPSEPQRAPSEPQRARATNQPPTAPMFDLDAAAEACVSERGR